MKLSRAIAIILGVCLLISGFVNIALFRVAAKSYREIQVVRLDPTSAGRFAVRNAGIRQLKPGETRIVFFGDSRIAHWKALPSLPNCQMLNRGVSGETTAQAILRLDRDVIALEPSIVVVQVGINDLKAIGVLPGRVDQIVRSCSENLKTIVRRAVASDIHVVILTIFRPGPVELGRRPVWSDEIGLAVERVNGMIKALSGQGVTIFNCDPVLVAGKRIKPQYARDALHLTSAGYERLNKSVGPILEQLVGQHRAATVEN
jgi:lysophospholipase L1-like esterase